MIHHGMPQGAGAGRPAPLVLVVDDFEDNRAMYAEYLTFSGYRVEQASNGEEAVELTQRLKPDVVVMDLSLPIMDGWEATRRLKADESTRHIPVIALTGHALAGHSRGAREAGCDAFLAKPCLPEKLVAKVQELMRAG
jgi:two-component system cell cycle response regulator DivK